MKATALFLTVAIAAGTSGCRTAPRMVPMIVDGNPVLALAMGANPDGDIHWGKTAGLAAGGGGIVGLIVWGIVKLAEGKSGDTYHLETQSGNVVFVGRDGTVSSRRDETEARE